MAKLTQIWRLFKILILPYWVSSEKWKALILLGLIITLNLAMVYLKVQINSWYGTFYNALQALNYALFKIQLLKFSGLAFSFIIISVYAAYLHLALQTNWRKWLTEHFLSKWLKNQRYYRLQLADPTMDNPDQRIAEDVKSLVSIVLELSIGLLSALVTLASFLSILATLSNSLDLIIGGYPFSIPNYMAWTAFAYALVGTIITIWIGKPLVTLDFKQERFEADFRFSLIRFRENTENIVVYKGEKVEYANLKLRLKVALDNFWQYMKWQKRLSWFTSGYAQLAIIFPILVASPRYFAKEITLGGLLQITQAFDNIQRSLSFIVSNFSSLSAWKAVVNRLTLFESAMEKADRFPRLTIAENNPCLKVTNLTITKPDKQVLVQDLSFQLQYADRLLVQGPSGCGKSTLLLSMLGVWPFAKGQISCPRGLRLALSQRPYLPLGTLRAALYYPQAILPEDPSLLSILHLAGLSHLIPFLDKIEPWSHNLSLGEQQRIAIARALLLKPDFLLMDESTSALDEPMEDRLYAALIAALPHCLIISIGHRHTLRQFHTHLLTINKHKNGNLLCI